MLIASKMTSLRLSEEDERQYNIIKTNLCITRKEVYKEGLKTLLNKIERTNKFINNK